jgi:hypothetical protein
MTMPLALVVVTLGLFALGCSATEAPSTAPLPLPPPPPSSDPGPVETAGPTVAPTPPPLPDAGAPSAACPPGAPWQTIDVGEFSFSAPCELVVEPVKGIDSKVGKYVSPTMVLTFDYGRYSSDLREFGGWPEHRAEQTTIAGKAATVVTFKGTGDFWAQRPFGAAVAFPRVVDGGAVRLTMVVQGKGAEDQAAAKKIFRSLRFR